MPERCVETNQPNQDSRRGLFRNLFATTLITSAATSAAACTNGYLALKSSTSSANQLKPSNLSGREVGFSMATLFLSGISGTASILGLWLPRLLNTPAEPLLSHDEGLPSQQTKHLE